MPPITAFRIKSGLSKPKQVLRDIESLEEISITVKGRVVGKLFVQRADPAPPKWLKFFSGHKKVDALQLTTSSVSAVYLVRTAKRHFAVTFGFGRYLLMDGVVEPRFGLKATLNAVAPEKLRSIDHKRLDAVPRLTREQLSTNAGIEQFGLNVERDMLRAIAGTPRDSELGPVLAGADQLAFSKKVTLANLGSTLDSFAALSEKTTYRDSFAWVDNIQEVTDSKLEARLEDALVQQVRKSDASSTWFGAPEILDWAKLGGYSYSSGKKGAEYPELILADYIKGFKRLSDITIDKLRSDRIRLLDVDSQEPRVQWPVIKCLCAEIRIGKQHFVLNEGRWYQVAKDFLEQVDDVVSSLPSTSAPLPPPKTGAREGAYLEDVAAGRPREFFLLDQKNITLAGRSAIEACDLLWKAKTFIHAKKYGASSKLSHLFSQGAVAATLFHAEQDFRRQVHEKLTVEHRWGEPADPIVASTFEVAYAVLIEKGQDPTLPFFSRVNLRNSVLQLRALGYKVSLTFVAG